LCHRIYYRKTRKITESPSDAVRAYVTKKGLTYEVRVGGLSENGAAATRRK